MIVEHRTLTIRLNDTVFARLIDRAREQGRTPTRYAQELFDAAWAARFGKDTGDAALERAVREAAKAAPAPTQATGPDPRDARINELIEERDALRTSLDATERTIEKWKGREDVWDERFAAAANEQIELLTAALAEAEAEIARLREQIAAAADCSKPAETTIEPAAIAPKDNPPVGPLDIVAQPEPAPEPVPEPQTAPKPEPQPTPSPEAARAPELAGCTVRMIKALRAAGMTPAEIARETDTSILDVRRVLERKAS